MGLESVISVANFFIRKGIVNQNPLTHMQIQKLVYFVHANLLASKKNGLAKNPFQAWEYGPVCKPLYQTLRVYGYAPITLPIVMQSDGSTEGIYLQDADIEASANHIWDKYSRFSAAQLSGFTHAPNSPWDMHYSKDTKNKIIPDSEIQKYFSEHYEKFF